MRNFLIKKMAVVSILLSSVNTVYAQSPVQDINDIDTVINNLIMIKEQQVPPAQQVFTPASVYNVTQNNQYPPSATAKNSKNSNAQYTNPFISGYDATTTSSYANSLVTQGSAPQKMAAYIARIAHDASRSKCALYVRKALQAAGYNVTPQASAYMYNNGEMTKIGFKKIPSANYQPQIGDVVVFNRTPTNPHGHIQIYTGNQWVSDFKQPRMMIYGDKHRGYTIYRDGRFVDASMKNNTTYLAMNN